MSDLPAHGVSTPVDNDVPAEVSAWIDVPRHHRTASFDVERSYAFNTCAATQNGNALYWDETVAHEITAGPTMPLATLSLWMRPHHWEPGATGEQVALETHFELKNAFHLPEAVMTANELTFFEPVRLGDRISHHQVLRSVSPHKTTKLGQGRFWVIDVNYHNQESALVGRERITGYGYRRTHTDYVA